MCDIPGLISRLEAEELARLRESGRERSLDSDLIDAIDTAAGGPGEGRGYYVVSGSLYPVEARDYHLREDVAEAVLLATEDPADALA
ncbi:MULTISPECIES: hypothetical protein [Arthrobacter]|uniref:Uncharacterized protein n=1 Tax=Arthrobacter terricola TaxID=2547396 RepID=A0A4V2ZU79_9MICC|nr:MULTISPECIES: hypothetical protein [Arthrobacter]MBT8160376.1 hypothetical protein [Arthrobacter sp. GN70]TDF99934.1 hypothetical protein E1809_04445 [Arthrobacter terricola]